MSLATSFTPDFFSNCVLENTSGLNISKEALRGKQYLSIYLGIPSGSAVKKKMPVMQEMWVWSLGWKDPLKKETATHSGILVWENPMVTEAWWALSVGSQRIRQDWAWMHLCLFNHPSIHPPAYLSITYLSIYLSIHPPAPHPGVTIHLPIQPFTNFLSCIFL